MFSGIFTAYGQVKEENYVSVVRDEKQKKSASETKIKREVLQSFPHKNTEEILRLVPGLLVVQHGAEGKGHQFFLRGFDAVHGADIEATMNGVPLNDVSNVHGQGYLDLYFIIPETINSITVLKGPFFLSQSDFATAGSIDFEIGIPPSRTESQIIFESGYPLRNRVAFIKPLTGLKNSFFASEYVTSEGFGQNRWSNRVSSIAKINKRLFSGEIEIIGVIYSARFGSPTALRYEDYISGKMGFYDSYTNLTDGHSDRALVSLSDKLDYGNGILKVNLFSGYRGFEVEDDYTGYLYYPEHGDFRRQNHDALDCGFGFSLNHKFERLGKKLELIILGKWRGDWINQTESRFDPVSGKAWMWSRNAAGGIHNLGLAIGGRWFARRWMIVEGGLRGDFFFMFLENRLDENRHYQKFLWTPSPKIAFIFPILPSITLFLSYGRGLRSPELRSIMVRDLPNEDVELQQYRGGEPTITNSDSIETGIEYSFSRYFRLNVSFFGTFISNETVYDHVSNTNLLLNSTRRLGGEMNLIATPFRWLVIQGSICGVDARFVESQNRIPGAPWLITALMGTILYPEGFELGISGFYIPPRPLAHGAEGMSELMLNLSASYKWKFLKFGVQIQNLLNRKICEGQYHYASWFDLSEPRSSIPVIHCCAGEPLSFRGGITFFI